MRKRPRQRRKHSNVTQRKSQRVSDFVGALSTDIFFCACGYACSLILFVISAYDSTPLDHHLMHSASLEHMCIVHVEHTQ